MRLTIDLGIDLGTTNSIISQYNHQLPVLFKDQDQNIFLPSAVYVSKLGDILTGFPALAKLAEDPENGVIEFKRQMGSSTTYHLQGDDSPYTPELLSSYVLKTLLQRAETQLGHRPKAAVITIPAMFQLPQAKATQLSAKLAGITYAPLLQEPIAAAIAHARFSEQHEGFWLIYDMGGGTFDVSLVRIKVGRLQVVDHDGNNHLGGKDLDRAVAQTTLQHIRSKNNIPELKRSNPRFAKLFSALKMEAERLRLHLSEHQEGVFQLQKIFSENETEIQISEISFTRDELEDILKPTLLQSTQLCQEMLSRNRLKTQQINGIVMVGGPTQTPFIPSLLEQELAIKAMHYVNPMHIVAYGAAIFASTQKLPLDMRAPFHKTAPKATIDLEFLSMTTNPRPFLTGKVTVPPGSQTDPAWLTVKRVDSNSEGVKVTLNESNSFAVQLDLNVNTQNEFRLRLFDTDGRDIPCLPSEITIIHGLSVAPPPLSQTIGVMLADNSVATYIKKGSSLPAEYTMTHATTAGLKKGESGEAINVPVVQGENKLADRNKVIGLLRIYAESISEDLPSGSTVKVSIYVDQFSNTKTRAYVPLLDQWFEDVLQLKLENSDAGELEKKLAAQTDRLKELSKLAEELEDSTQETVDARVKEIEQLLEEGDGDSLDVAEQLIRRVSTSVDVYQESNQHALMVNSFTNIRKETEKLFKELGYGHEQKVINALNEEFENSIARDDFITAESKLNDARALYMRTFTLTPKFWIGMFGYLVNHIQQTGDGGDAAQALILEGAKSLQKQDYQSINQICVDIMRLLPKQVQDAVTSQII